MRTYGAPKETIQNNATELQVFFLQADKPSLGGWERIDSLPALAVMSMLVKIPDLNFISSGVFVGQRFQYPAFERGQIIGSKGRGSIRSRRVDMQ